MTTITIYPYLLPDDRVNPYITDFAQVLRDSGRVQVVNPPSRNPLLSILPPGRWGRIVMFHWFEIIPDFKYGVLQSLVAVIYIALLCLTNRRVVWFFHDQDNRSYGHQRLKGFLKRYIMRMSHVIITHSAQGVKIMREHYPSFAHKAHFLDHPTKCRLMPEPSDKRYDLLVWGNISPYKGITELLRFLHDTPSFQPRLCIAGRCQPETEASLRQLLKPNIDFIPRSLSFDEVGQLIAQSRFVLVPYLPESVLSSATLMDSLSFGAKVIGPDIGSFRDYSNDHRLCVYTFQSLADLPDIVNSHADDAISVDGYRDFLSANDWPHFVQQFIDIIEKA